MRVSVRLDLRVPEAWLIQHTHLPWTARLIGVGRNFGLWRYGDGLNIRWDLANGYLSRPATVHRVGAFAISVPAAVSMITGGHCNLLESASAEGRVLEVYHCDLPRSGDSHLASACPVCADGILSMQRSLDDFLLLEHDLCGRCGQRVRYLDIAQLQIADWAGRPE